MTIIETNLTITGATATRSKTARIILHHAAAVSCTVEDIHRWHQNNGWGGIGYHYFVNKSGAVYRGRPESMQGVHAGNNNGDSIGICFEGNFEAERMGGAQLSAGAELIGNILTRYGSLSIIRHKDVNATACPGANFPFDDMTAKAAGSSESSQGQAATSTGWQVGDTVTLNGYVYTDSYGSGRGKHYAGKTGKITKKVDLARLCPYHFEGLGWVTSESVGTSSAQASFSVGDKIRVKSTATHFATGEKMLSFVPESIYYIRQKKENKILISPEKTGAYTGWIYTSDAESA